MPRVFVSVAHNERHLAEALKRILVGHSGRGGQSWVVFCYTEDIGAEDWVHRIDDEIQQIRQHDYFVVIATAAWEKSANCLYEFAAAKAQDKRILAFRPTDRDTPIKGYPYFGNENQLPLFEAVASTDVSPRNTTVLHDGRQVRVQITERALKEFQLIGDQDEFAAPEAIPVDKDTAPYAGMRPLEIWQGGIFFGRNQEIARAISEFRTMTRNTKQGVFYIHGPSGVGKSSFMKAGLISRLERARRDYVVLPVFTPGARPFAQFKSWLGDTLKLAKYSDFNPDFLATAPAAELAALLRKKFDEEAEKSGFADRRPLIIPLDQGEELVLDRFGRTIEEQKEVESFFELINGVLAAQTGIYVFATVREEYTDALVGRLQSAEPRAFALSRMGDAGLEQIIKGPISRPEFRAATFSEDLVTRLKLDALKLQRPESRLPLLAFTLERIWLNVQPDAKGVLDLPDWYRGLEDALDEAVAQACKELQRDTGDLAKDQQDLQEELKAFFFRFFLHPSEGENANGRARIVFQACAAEDLEHDDRHLQIAEKFTSQRVLVGRLIPRPEGRPVRGYYIGHEALADRWAWMRDWITDHRDNIDLVGRIRTNAQRWEHDKKRPGTAFLSPYDYDRLSSICDGDIGDVRGKVVEKLNMQLSISEEAFVSACHEYKLESQKVREAEITDAVRPYVQDNVKQKQQIATLTDRSNQLQSHLASAREETDGLTKSWTSARRDRRIAVVVAIIMIVSVVILAPLFWFWSGIERSQAITVARSDGVAEGRRTASADAGRQKDNAVALAQASMRNEKAMRVQGCWTVVKSDPKFKLDCYSFSIALDMEKLRLDRACAYSQAPVYSSEFKISPNDSLIADGHNDRVPGAWHFEATSNELVWSHSTPEGTLERVGIFSRTCG